MQKSLEHNKENCTIGGFKRNNLRIHYEELSFNSLITSSNGCYCCKFTSSFSAWSCSCSSIWGPLTSSIKIIKLWNDNNFQLRLDSSFVSLNSHVCSGFSNTASSWMKAACLCHVYSLSHDGVSLHSFSRKRKERTFYWFFMWPLFSSLQGRMEGSCGVYQTSLGQFPRPISLEDYSAKFTWTFANPHEHHHIIECVHCCQVHAIVPILLPIWKFRLVRHYGP